MSHMINAFRFRALPLETFAPLFPLTDDALAAKGVRRMIAAANPGYPCRVSLVDAEPGERVLLLPFTHQPAASPYHASGAIFVRERAQEAVPEIGEVPELLRGRTLSVRAYDADGMMIDADLCEGRQVETLIERFFSGPSVVYLHVHNARPGCYACRVDRA